MPYIDKKLRKKYDVYLVSIIDVKDPQSGLLLFKSAELVDKIRKEKLRNQDGIINYILTMLIRKYPMIPLEVSNMVLGFLYLFYMKPESYMMYNRLMGLLICMLEEHARRGWYMPLWFIELSHKIYYERIGPYEDKKITMNGDLVDAIQ